MSLPAVTLHNIDLTWWIGDLAVGADRTPRGWRIRPLEPADRWVRQHDLGRQTFPTRKAAVQAVLAFDAIDPCPRNTGTGFPVKLSRRPDGALVDQTGRWTVYRDGPIWFLSGPDSLGINMASRWEVEGFIAARESCAQVSESADHERMMRCS